MKKLLLRSAVVTVLVAGVVALVTHLPSPPHLHGQDGPPGAPGRGGFGGPPGYGGPRGPGGMPPSNVMLVMAPEVQAELSQHLAQLDH